MSGVPDRPRASLQAWSPFPGGSARSWLQATAVGLVLTYLAVTTFPAVLRAIVPGLDPSWVYAINVLPSSDFTFGRDVVFSFGPLGYLLVPLDIESNLIQAAALWVIVQVAMIAVAVHHYRRSGRLEPILVFAVIFLLAGTVGQIDEYRTLVILGLMLSVAPLHRRAWVLATATAAVLAGVLAFARLSTGIATVAMLGLCTVAWLVRREIRLREALAVVVLPFVATAAILTGLIFGGPRPLGSWIAASLQYTSGYSEAMSYPGPVALLLLFGGGLVVFMATAALLARRAPAVIPVALALGALMLLGFRHGMVRHHARFVPAIVLGSIAVLALVVGTRRAALQAVIAAVVVVGLSIGASEYPECFCPWAPEAVGPGRGWNGVVSLVRFPETRREIAALSAARLAEDRLPQPYLTSMRGGTADAIPWEIVFIPANDLRWQPNPVLQTYSAYTAELDRRAAAHFASAEAPDSLLVQFVEIDARHPMLGAPAMWRAILSRYEPSPLPIAPGSWGEVALLRRRAVALDLAGHSVGSATGRVGEWVDIPPSDGLVFGSIRLRHDLGGRLASVFWRVDPLLLELRLADGGTVTMRFLPSTAQDGLLLNRLPMTLSELLDLYRGTLPRELTAFRVHGAGTGSFERQFEVVWTEAAWGRLRGLSRRPDSLDSGARGSQDA